MYTHTHIHTYKYTYIYVNICSLHICIYTHIYMHIRICKCMNIYIHILTWHSRRPLKLFRFLCDACLCLRQNCFSFPIKPYCTCDALAAHPSEKLHRRFILLHTAFLGSFFVEFVATFSTPAHIVTCSSNSDVVITTACFATPTFLCSIGALLSVWAAVGSAGAVETVTARSHAVCNSVATNSILMMYRCGAMPMRKVCLVWLYCMYNMYMCIYVCICVYVCKCVYMYIQVYMYDICEYRYVYIYIYTQTCIYIYIYFEKQRVCMDECKYV